MLKNSRIYGPVLAKRSTGTWRGLEFDVEVWPILGRGGIGTEYIVEVSFKTPSRMTASANHDELIEWLTTNGWLLGPGFFEDLAHYDAILIREVYCH